MLKKFGTIALAVAIVFVVSACTAPDSSSDYKPKEQPHLYWKNVDATVIDIDNKTWFYITHWWVVDIIVEVEEYGLTESFTIKKSGAFNRPKEWRLKKGDTVEVTLYSWKMDSTGEIVKREIHSIN
jgi:hypothetical protein